MPFQLEWRENIMRTESWQLALDRLAKEKKPWTENRILIKLFGEWYSIDGRRQPKHKHTQIEAWRTKNPGPLERAEGQ